MNRWFCQLQKKMKKLFYAHERGKGGLGSLLKEKTSQNDTKRNLLEKQYRIHWSSGWAGGVWITDHSQHKKKLCWNVIFNKGIRRLIGSLLQGWSK